MSNFFSLPNSSLYFTSHGHSGVRSDSHSGVWSDGHSGVRSDGHFGVWSDGHSGVWSDGHSESGQMVTPESGQMVTPSLVRWSLDPESEKMSYELLVLCSQHLPVNTSSGSSTRTLSQFNTTLTCEHLEREQHEEDAQPVEYNTHL